MLILLSKGFFHVKFLHVTKYCRRCKIFPTGPYSVDVRHLGELTELYLGILM